MYFIGIILFQRPVLDRMDGVFTKVPPSPTKIAMGMGMWIHYARIRMVISGLFKALKDVQIPGHVVNVQVSTKPEIVH